MNGLIDELFVKIGFKVEDKDLADVNKKINSTLTSVRNLALAVGGAVLALDRMATSLAKNNQNFINFTRQTGLAIDQLNKIAGAGMLADFNFSPEKALSGLQAIQSSLASISIGQGNVAPYQILGINPVGKNAVQIVEDLRVALKGVDDAMAVNLIQQMGLSPEFLTILRMTREEYEELSATAQQFMLTGAERKQLANYAMELRKIHLELSYLKDKALIAILPYLNKFLQGLTSIAEATAMLAKFLKDVFEKIGACKGAFIALTGVIGILLWKIKPLWVLLTALYLILEDIAVWVLGGKSLIGLVFDLLGYRLDMVKEGLQDLFAKATEGMRGLAKIWAEIWNIKLPPHITAILGLATALKSGFSGVKHAFGQARAEQAINGATSGGNTGLFTSNRVINQTNNINLPNGSPESVANEINDLTFAYAQMQEVYV